MRKYYNRTNTCDRCGINFDKSYGNSRREYDEEEKWTGRWLCNSCHDVKRRLSYNTIKSIDERITENKFISIRIIDGKPRQVIVDENGKIINRNPTKEELKGFENEKYNTKKKYTDNELLEYLKKFHDENGVSPIIADFDNSSRYPSPGQYKRFGGWNKALKMAGLEIKSPLHYTDNELLGYLKEFYDENERPPTTTDFHDDLRYPDRNTYAKHFGSWSKALRLVELDVDTMVKNGVLATNHQKARLAEILVRNHFENNPIDIAGENQNSHYDGICPNGKTYDVKSSGLLVHNNKIYYNFCIDNKFKDEIEIFYLLAFNKNYTKLDYAWRVPGK